MLKGQDKTLVTAIPNVTCASEDGCDRMVSSVLMLCAISLGNVPDETYDADDLRICAVTLSESAAVLEALAARIEQLRSRPCN